MRFTPLLVVLLLACFPFALAEEGHGSVERDARRIEAESDGSGATIHMKSASGAEESQVEIQYRARDGTMQVEYQSQNATAQQQLELHVQFRELVEFRDANGDGAYTPGTDSVVAKTDLRSLPWTVAQPVSIATPDGGSGRSISGTASLPEGGALTFVLDVYGVSTTLNGTALRPAEAKIDLKIDGYRYAANDTRLAFVAQAATKSEIDHARDDDGRGDGVSTTAGDLRAFFSWSPTAKVDGADKPVRSVVLRSTNSSEDGEASAQQVITLAYERGSSIDHDPILGIASASAPARGVPGAEVGIVAFAAGAAALVYARRRP